MLHCWKKTRQINCTNIKLEPVESKKLFWWLVPRNFQQAMTFYLNCYFIPSFSAMLHNSFPFILIYHTGFLQFLILHRKIFSTKWIATGIKDGYWTLNPTKKTEMIEISITFIILFIFRYFWEKVSALWGQFWYRYPKKGPILANTNTDILAHH